MSLDGNMELERARWRQAAEAGTITNEDMRQWIELVRGGRRAAAETSARSRARKAAPDVDALIREIDNI